MYIGVHLTCLITWFYCVGVTPVAYLRPGGANLFPYLQLVWIQSFSFSKTDCHTKLDSSFLNVLMLYEIRQELNSYSRVHFQQQLVHQKCLLYKHLQYATSTFNNHYTISASVYMCTREDKSISQQSDSWILIWNFHKVWSSWKVIMLKI